MATPGGFMMGVNVSTPNIPRFVTVKVAARFLQRVKQMLENPYLLLI
jgi:pyruvate/2-oxoglutarate dehydrogenase complex dihydrolipoamide acyltransferase (E2) component